MSNTKMIIEERSRDIGQFTVGRLIPFVKKRAVGPFVFIDKMGPESIGENGKYLDIDQHPHIGLSTLTYLFEGQIHHRDSTGADQIIEPGSVNLMVSGRGVSHTERTPLSLRDGRITKIYGYQVWIALPEESEFIEPAFYHYEKKLLPQWSENGLKFKLIVGEVLGKKSPVIQHSPTFMIDIFAEEDSILNLSGRLFGELGIVVVQGTLFVDDFLSEDNLRKIEIQETEMLVSNVQDFCEIEVKKGTHLLIFGGEPLSKRYLLWNFVASNPQTLENAKEDWKNHKFPKVPGDDTYIPIPEK